MVFSIEKEMRVIGLFAIFALFAIPSLAHAQIGERAGPLQFNVSIGGNETIPWTIFNNGNSTVYFVTYVGALQQSDNQITPTIVLMPVNGSIAAHSSIDLNITVYMPAQNQPGRGSWSTILQVIQTSNQTASGGSAVIMAGLAKAMDIVSKLPPPTTTTIPTMITQSESIFPLGSAAIAIVVALIALGAAGYMLSQHKKRTARKRARKAPAKRARRRPAARRSSARRSRTPRARSSARTTRRRRRKR